MRIEQSNQSSSTKELDIIKKLHQQEKITYSLTNDYMFRAVLQSSEIALRGLLAALLKIPEDEIHSCRITNPIILGDTIDEKNCVLDIRLELNNYQKINLEMQVGYIENWTDRSLYYLCRMHTDLERGLDYASAKPSLHIGIVTKSPIPEDTAFYNEYSLRNRKTNYEYTGKFEIRVLDLSQLPNVSDEDKNTPLYYWAQLFVAKTWKELFEMADKSEAIEKAVVTLHQLSEDEKIKLQCEARERYWMDWQSSMRTNYQKGQAAEKANTLKEKERADREKQRADTEKNRADSEKDRADSEKARADKIEAEKQSMQLEIERLKRLLEKGQE